MDQVLVEKMEKFIKDATDAMKLNKDNSDAKIASVEAALRKELQDYRDEVKRLNVSVPGLAEEEAKRKEKGTQFSLSKAVFAIARSTRKDLNAWEGAEHELKVFEEAYKRSTVNGMTGGQGGYLIPVEIAREILKPAIASIVMRELGITVYEDLVGDLPFPEITSRPTLSWVKESASATAQGITFGERVMRPKTGSMLVKISQKLMMQTSGVAEQVVREMMQEGIALGLDDMMMNGAGSDKVPLGIFNNTAITASTAIGTSGGRLRFDKVASMIADVQDRNYLKTPGIGGLLTHTRVVSGMKRERVAQYSGDTAGMPLVNPMMSDKVLEDVTGLKIRATTAVPHVGVKSSSGASLAKAIVGEFKQFCLGTWGGLMLRASDQAGTAFENNELWIVAFLNADTMVKQTDAFSLITDAQTDESKW